MENFKPDQFKPSGLAMYGNLAAGNPDFLDN
jgi:hypothetical protein